MRGASACLVLLVLLAAQQSAARPGGQARSPSPSPQSPSPAASLSPLPLPPPPASPPPPPPAQQPQFTRGRATFRGGQQAAKGALASEMACSMGPGSPWAEVSLERWQALLVRLPVAFPSREKLASAGSPTPPLPPTLDVPHPPPQAHLAALSLRHHPRACGLCLLAVCSDPATCPPSSAAAQPLLVADDCGSCADNELLVSPATFRCWALGCWALGCWAFGTSGVASGRPPPPPAHRAPGVRLPASRMCRLPPWRSLLTGYDQRARPLPPSGWAATEWRFIPCSPFLFNSTISMRVMPGGGCRGGVASLHAATVLPSPPTTCISRARSLHLCDSLHPSTAGLASPLPTTHRQQRVVQAGGLQRLCRGDPSGGHQRAGAGLERRAAPVGRASGVGMLLRRGRRCMFIARPHTSLFSSPLPPARLPAMKVGVVGRRAPVQRHRPGDRHSQFSRRPPAGGEPGLAARRARPGGAVQLKATRVLTGCRQL